MRRPFISAPDEGAIRHEPARLEPMRSGAGRARVLVVEDNADARAIMVILLEQWGYKVWSAADGQEGIERARATCPDVALVDIGLPGVDGYGVAHALRSSPETEGIRLVALTGHAEKPDREQAGTGRFDLHLTKPVDPGHLRSVLAELLQA